jgi:hypothetical protein
MMKFQNLKYEKLKEFLYTTENKSNFLKQNLFH